MEELLLEVSGLSKYFPVTAGLFKRVVGSIRALEDINFTLHKGQVLGVVGESGSGKSTMARAVTRLIEPSAGSIRLMGEEWTSLTQAELLERRSKVQMVFQDPFSSLNPRKTIGDSLGEPLRYHRRVKNKVEEVACVEKVLKQIGLSPDVMQRYPHQFSGGQQQRICIGRALVLRPQLII
ncbi:MAG: ATP-binding cassette domain-containing protein, partial [Parachlamydiaceae bacterium]